MTRYVVLAAVLAGGCEQLKSPQRISELEQRVEKLSNEVETMRGGSGAKKPGSGKHGAGSGSGEAGGSAAASKAAEPGGDGEAAGAGAGEAAHGGGEGGHGDGAPADGHGEGAADKQAAGHGEDEAAAEKAKAGHDGDGAADKPAHGEELPGEAGKDDGAHDGEGDKAKAKDAEDKAKGKDAEDKAGGEGKELDKADQALAELRDVVAKSIQNGKPGAAGKPGAVGGKPKPEPPHWTYEGKTASPMWGKLDPVWKTCGDGKAQSPIDIQPRAGSASPIEFHYQPTAATVVDNGHTLQVNLAPGSSIEINGGVYQLLQFHLHTPSEHTVAGERYPLELHLVHQDSDGRLAVIGVMYDTGVESKALGSVFAKWPRKGSDEKIKKFDPSELLPQTRSVFRYTGSLTTPPCSEGVSWNVMRRAMTDSKSHLDVFTKHYSHNARDLQPLNDRKVE